MTSIMSSMKYDGDNMGESMYNSDSLDSEADAPFRIIDPASIMETDFLEEDDEDEEDEEYDEEELLHFAETRPSSSQHQNHQQQQLPQPHARQRKQQIQHLNRDDEQFNFLTVQEYSAMEKQNKTCKKSAKDKLYMLNPDDFKNDRLKQQQIRRAKVTHNHHRRKNREIQRLQGENAKLKDLVTFYEQRERRIKQSCRCDAVAKILSNRPNVNGCGVVNDEDHPPKISPTKASDIQTPPTPANIMKASSSLPLPLKTYSRQPQDFKGVTLSNKHGNNDQGTSSLQQSSSILAGPSTSATASALLARKTISSITPNNPKSINTTRQSLPGSFAPRQETIAPKPPPLIPSPLVQKSSSTPHLTASTSTTQRNVLIAHKGVNGTRLVQVSASALPSFAGIFDSTKHKEAEVKAKRTFSRMKPDNNKTAAAITGNKYKKINPLSRLKNTLKSLNAIVQRRQDLRNGVKSNDADKESEIPTVKLLDTEITEEILRYWSDEVIPLPVRAVPRTITYTSASQMLKAVIPTTSPPSPIGNIHNDEESPSQRRSKRSAATSRLSTAELLSGTKSIRSKISGPEQIIDYMEEALDNLDWKTIELQYLQPRQIYSMMS